MIESPAHQLLTLLLSEPTLTQKRLHQLKRSFANTNKTGIITNAALLHAYREALAAKEVERNQQLEHLLVKRAIRTLSGVAPITIMTAPLGCPKNCLYCPTERNMPKSYLSNQPAAMRAVLSDFDPVIQTETRLRALKANGHSTDKIEIIILGGTWSSHPVNYQRWFIASIFETCNAFNENTVEDHGYHDPATAKGLIHDKLEHRSQITESLYSTTEDESLIARLTAAQTVNETATNRIIGITIETRPDHISPKELKRLRELGVTKVEIGVQTVYDDVATLNRRDQTLGDVAYATKLLKDAGFKVAYHIMPGMYGSTPERDVKMFETLFSDERLKPDFLKIYPCVVLPQSDLFELFKNGTYVPYSCETLIDTIVKAKEFIPPYTRIARLHRDIPADSIVGGCSQSNIRESIQVELAKRQQRCHCIRCREPMNATTSPQAAVEHSLQIPVEDSTEYFLTFDSSDEQFLYAFLRLRLPATSNGDVTAVLPELNGAALVREIHTYGVLTPLVDDGTSAVQHKGLGRKLMASAEAIAKQHGCAKIAVIAGVGVREYYRMLGYVLEGTYMVKTL